MHSKFTNSMILGRGLYRGSNSYIVKAFQSNLSLKTLSKRSETGMKISFQNIPE